MNKFENVDLFASLGAIMRQNTAFYQSDFEIDKQIIQKAAASPTAEDKMLLWLSRPSGTHCFRERDVFLKDTAAHNTWRFYAEQTHDHILAYAVAITGSEDGKMKGSLYELEYPQHFRHIIDHSLPAETYTLIYEHGSREQPSNQYFNGNPDPQLGKFERFEAQPNDPEALRYFLQEEKRSRDKLTPGNFRSISPPCRTAGLKPKPDVFCPGFKTSKSRTVLTRPISWWRYHRILCSLRQPKTPTVCLPCCPLRR